MSEPIVVTGASRGIGKAVARRLARLGHPVVAWARSEEDLAALRAADPDGRITTCRVDVGDWDSVARGVRTSLAGATALRGVVVNAGVGEWGEVGDLPGAAWQTMLATNVSGAFHTLAQLRPLLLARPEGSQVVTMVSDSALHPFPGRSAYCSSKAALASLTETFRREVRGNRVRVTALYPGRVDTHFRGRQPGDRPEILQPEDIAATVEHVFALPDHVELRELSICSIHSTYGPFEESAPTEVARVR
ncbi:SDR family oxidoreductase [Streptomyces sp. NPDC051994]|uniref:SDR family oxidoreductase n=1 Tax=unclassified Streptomyces TaxID=2593676 RepID=UPI003421F8F7